MNPIASPSSLDCSLYPTWMLLRGALRVVAGFLHQVGVDAVLDLGVTVAQTPQVVVVVGAAKSCAQLVVDGVNAATADTYTVGPLADFIAGFDPGHDSGG